MVVNDPTKSVRGDDDHDRFVGMLPLIRRIVLYALRTSPEHVRDECVAECVANAYCTFHSLAKKGRADRAFGSALAKFALRQFRAGRHVGGRVNSRDVMSEAARQRHGIKVRSLDSHTPSIRWDDVLTETKQCTPADVAVARLDIQAWLDGLDPRRRKVAAHLARGESTSEAAQAFGVTPGRISQLRAELQRSWELFQNGLLATC